MFCKQYYYAMLSQQEVVANLQKKIETLYKMYTETDAMLQDLKEKHKDLLEVHEQLIQDTKKEYGKADAIPTYSELEEQLQVSKETEEGYLKYAIELSEKLDQAIQAITQLENDIKEKDDELRNLREELQTKVEETQQYKSRELSITDRAKRIDSMLKDEKRKRKQAEEENQKLLEENENYQKELQENEELIQTLQRDAMFVKEAEEACIRLLFIILKCRDFDSISQRYQALQIHVEHLEKEREESRRQTELQTKSVLDAVNQKLEKMKSGSGLDGDATSLISTATLGLDRYKDDRIAELDSRVREKEREIEEHKQVMRRKEREYEKRMDEMKREYDREREERARKEDDKEKEIGRNLAKISSLVHENGDLHRTISELKTALSSISKPSQQPSSSISADVFADLGEKIKLHQEMIADLKKQLQEERENTEEVRRVYEAKRKADKEKRKAKREEEKLVLQENLLEIDKMHSEEIKRIKAENEALLRKEEELREKAIQSYNKQRAIVRQIKIDNEKKTKTLSDERLRVNDTNRQLLEYIEGLQRQIEAQRADREQSDKIIEALRQETQQQKRENESLRGEIGNLKARLILFQDRASFIPS
ncbi:uncharacterized protein MONOS_6823 [Monocercomonoides exilis]|uniref:uncharacterized protein n=1 Tax=Monocercomonoides exilis TaxID=2049356 RepID=UPI00355A2CBB|nr:hypothetical protein MONOS_6823 [Monocercomonoides exilis]|eukprot:MONOS_6823.1-p1 / transcript=MONOS_6823.1 / gene=MONOS_6823 / organism=Monocercomonoides_exilis_PA203 / gene_product=unspecified product / transcript_product=unspecified product / location=Mono_scaffold00222:54860-57796(-) / protein_length=598 / sequence_SO=supercontig / SO=protein_coding / is_pseudo=false